MAPQNLNKTMLYHVSEWDWLKIQLMVARRSSELLSCLYEFRGSDSPMFEKPWLPETVDIVCMIFGAHTREMIQNRASKEEQLEYYQAWVRLEKAKIEKIVRTLPVLGKEFDFGAHVAFMIMHAYGMGSSKVCMLIGDDVTWFSNEPPESANRT
jgi:hypothetical protein